MTERTLGIRSYQFEELQEGGHDRGIDYRFVQVPSSFWGGFKPRRGAVGGVFSTVGERNSRKYPNSRSQSIKLQKIIGIINTEGEKT